MLAIHSKTRFIANDFIVQHDLMDYELTEELEARILAGLADLDAGAGIPLADAMEAIKEGLGRS
jgi:predicted transcriptional regulator